MYLILRRPRFRPFSLFLALLSLALLLVLALPALASAAVVKTTPTLVLPKTEVWTIVIGLLVPLVTYVLNHVGPWATEPVKAFVMALAAAIAGALYTGLSTSVLGFNDATLQLVLSSVLAAFAAHKLIWQPSTISTLLGGGSNAQRLPKATTPAAASVPPAAAGPAR